MVGGLTSCGTGGEVEWYACTTGPGHVNQCYNWPKPLDAGPKPWYSMSMKNNKAMNLSQLAAAGTALDLVVADVQGQIKFTKLATRKPRQHQLAFTTGYRTTGVRAAGVKIRGGNGHNAGGKVG